MNEFDWIKKLSLTGKLRNTLYMEDKKVENYFIQKISAVTEVTQKKDMVAKAGFSILGFLGDISGGEGFETSVKTKPMLQAIVAENAARELNTLIDLGSAEPIGGDILYYLGPARITIPSPDNPLVAEELPPNSCSRIMDRKQNQDEALQWLEKESKTILLTFVARDTVFAAIASTKWVDANIFSSYHAQEHFGILCTMEGKPEPEVTFLNPLWIWYE